MTWGEFKGDLRASLRAWASAPLLPVISVGLYLMVYIPDPWWWLALPAVLFAVGWLGTERIWYLRIYRDEPVTPGELQRLTRAFFGRFMRLGLVAALLWAPLLILAIRNADPEQAEEAFTTPAMWIASAVLSVIIDFTLTFVTPALAFSTKRVGQALRLGLGMLRDHWPRTAWYAIVPPLAVLLMFRIAEPSSVGIVPRLLIAAGSALLNLWFKGATAAFYLRRVDVGPQGAAFDTDTEPPTPQPAIAPGAYGNRE